MTALETIAWIGVALSLAYAGIALACLERWFSRRAKVVCGDLVPVTFLRPLKGGVPALRENLEALVRAMEDDDQLVFGVDVESAEARLCEELRAAFPHCDLVVVPCARGVARNPKISKLAQMARQARHEHWIVADSEGWLDAEFLAGFRREWRESGVDVLTAGYRVAGLRSWPQRLDAAAVLLTLWPGLAVLRAVDGVRFTLGACTGVRRSEVAGVGGWAAFGEELAEDNRLGAALAAAGRRIRLSRHVVTLESDALGWREWWRHQRRVAVTYRIGNPAGFAGSIVTHGEFWALLLVVAGERLGWLALGVSAATRLLVAARMARRLDFSIPALPLAVLGASAMNTLCWLASWATVSVWWGGKWWRVSFRGRFRQEAEPGREFVCPESALPP